MSNPVSPLDGAAYAGFVTVTENPPQGMISLRGDLNDPTMQHAVTGICGGALPAPLTITPQGCGWMSPDELLLLLPRADASGALAHLADALGETHHLAADVSDARAMFTLHGAAIRDVLAKLTPADVSPQALPPMTLRRTRLAQVPAALWLSDETTGYVICFRSVAQYMFDLLSISARPGSEII